MSARARRRELALERSALENGVVVVVACMATREGRRWRAGESASMGVSECRHGDDDALRDASDGGRGDVSESRSRRGGGNTTDGPFDRSSSSDRSTRVRASSLTKRLIHSALTHRVMLRLRGGRRGERKTRTLASTAARAAMSFVLYARDMVPEVMTVVEEEEDEQSATTSGRDGDGDDDDDAMDVATDDDDSEEKDAMKMPFNAPTLTLRRTRVGSRTTRRGEPGGSRSRDERAKARREDETRRALDAAFNARAMEILRPRSIVMMIGSTPHRPREVYELDLRAVEYADEDSDDEDKDDAKKIRDAVSRRAIRAFVPLVADCAPPGPRSGLRAFFFVEASTPRDDDDVNAPPPPPGFAPKRAFAPSLARCVERRRVRVVRDDDDDGGGTIDDVLDNRLRREDGWTWYQASAFIRASRR